ncbi:MAG: DUF3421 domain-containing protein [Alphaproteobacteria bacterium]|nr:DUF3421 domain-containing protein [Alphaproteobacteria bacterium]
MLSDDLGGNLGHGRGGLSFRRAPQGSGSPLITESRTGSEAKTAKIPQNSACGFSRLRYLVAPDSGFSGVDIMKFNRISAAAAALVTGLCAAGAQADGLTWVPNTEPASRQNVILGGQEPGRTLPICRAAYQNGLHPGKIVAGNCNFGWGGKEILNPKFDVLTGRPAIRWIAARNGAPLPAGAFIGGSEPARLLPVCRAAYQQGVHPGKVVAGNCNFGWGGKEIVLAAYEVMVPGLPAGAIGAAGAGVQAVGVSGAGVQGVGAVSQPTGGDMEALLAAYTANLSKEQAAKLQGALQKTRERNAKLAAAAGIRSTMAAAKKKGVAPAKADPAIAKYFSAVGIAYGKSWDANEAALKKYMDSLAKDSQSDMGKLQGAIDKRNQTMQMMTNILKQMQDTQRAIIANMR